MKENFSLNELKSLENKIYNFKLLVPLIGIITYLLSVSFKFSFKDPKPILVLSIIYLFTLILFHLVFKRIKNTKKALKFFLSINIIEIIFTNFLIFFTGGVASPLFILYIMIILNISIIRKPFYPTIIFMISLFSYLTIAILQYNDIIPYIDYFSKYLPKIEPPFIEQRLFIVVIFLFIFSYYAERITRELNKERKSLELLREGVLLLTSYIGDREKFLNNLVKIAREIVNGDSSSIIGFENGSFKFLAWDGLDKDIIKDVEEALNITKPINLIEIKEKKKIIKYDDTFKIPHWVKIPNIRSYIGAPIIYKDEVIAILNVDSKYVNNFDETDVLNVEILSKSISTIIEKDELFKKISDLNQELEKISIKDPLTNIYNRRKMSEILKYQINVYLRRKENFQLIMFDIDNFKKINDSLGHYEGDKFLKSFSELLEKNIRKIDFVFRYGGDEFIIIIPNSPPPTVFLVMKRLKEKFKEKFKFYINSFNIDISYGFLSFDDFYKNLIEKGSEKSFDEEILFSMVLKQVDDSLYISKKLKHVD